MVNNRKSEFQIVMRVMLFLLLFLVIVSLAGCSWPTKEVDGRTHLVLGVGFITTTNDISQHEVGDGHDVQAEHIEATGVFASLIPSMSGLLVGHIKRQVLEIEPNAKIVIDSETGSDGLTKVKVWQPGTPPVPVLR